MRHAFLFAVVFAGCVDGHAVVDDSAAEATTGVECDTATEAATIEVIAGPCYASTDACSTTATLPIAEVNGTSLCESGEHGACSVRTSAGNFAVIW